MSGPLDEGAGSVEDGAGAGAPFTGSLPHASKSTQESGATALERFMPRKLALSRR